MLDMYYEFLCFTSFELPLKDISEIRNSEECN